MKQVLKPLNFYLLVYLFCVVVVLFFWKATIIAKRLNCVYCGPKGRFWSLLFLTCMSLSACMSIVYQLAIAHHSNEKLCAGLIEVLHHPLHITVKCTITILIFNSSSLAWLYEHSSQRHAVWVGGETVGGRRWPIGGGQRTW